MKPYFEWRKFQFMILFVVGISQYGHCLSDGLQVRWFCSFYIISGEYQRRVVKYWYGSIAPMLSTGLRFLEVAHRCTTLRTCIPQLNFNLSNVYQNSHSKLRTMSTFLMKPKNLTTFTTWRYHNRTPIYANVIKWYRRDYYRQLKYRNS